MSNLEFNTIKEIKSDPLHPNPTSKFSHHSKTANEMIMKYLGHSNRFKIKVNGVLETLKGVRLDRNDLETLFRDPDIEEVMLVFAINMDDVDNSSEEDQRLTTIVYGLEHTVKGDRSTAKIKFDRAYDFCDPCPPVCPTNMSELIS